MSKAISRRRGRLLSAPVSARSTPQRCARRAISGCKARARAASSRCSSKANCALPRGLSRRRPRSSRLRCASGANRSAGRAAPGGAIRVNTESAHGGPGSAAAAGCALTRGTSPRRSRAAVIEVCRHPERGPATLQHNEDASIRTDCASRRVGSNARSAAGPGRRRR